jgi:hypothetical protein
MFYDSTLASILNFCIFHAITESTSLLPILLPKDEYPDGSTRTQRENIARIRTRRGRNEDYSKIYELLQAPNKAAGDYCQDEQCSTKSTGTVKSQNYSKLTAALKP